MVKWWDAEAWTAGRVVLAAFLAAALAGAVLFNLPGGDDGDSGAVLFAVAMAVGMAGYAVIGLAWWLIERVRRWSLVRKRVPPGH